MCWEILGKSGQKLFDKVDLAGTTMIVERMMEGRGGRAGTYYSAAALPSRAEKPSTTTSNRPEMFFCRIVTGISSTRMVPSFNALGVADPIPLRTALGRVSLILHPRLRLTTQD